MKILVKITKEVLKRAAMCSSEVGNNCGIAVAIRDIFPTAWVNYGSVVVCDHSLSFAEIFLKENGIDDTQNGEIGRFDLPVNARNFIYEFDQLEPQQRVLMPEIAFEIAVPPPLIEAIGISQAYKILSESKTLELISI